MKVAVIHCEDHQSGTDRISLEKILLTLWLRQLLLVERVVMSEQGSQTLLELPQPNSLEFPHRLCPFLPINLHPNLSVLLRKNNRQQEGLVVVVHA